ncbi:MAG: dGTP triphosphohydrolase [Planctomycetota bacterium]
MRTDFQRDRDRVIHSTAFRRLQHKTQVLAAFEGDHYRSRMTHSLEVAQMARGVATALRLNADLAEAIALAHDLGHPPFGHAGEAALAELMQDEGGFRHNAQGARIVDYIEDRHGHGHGLNLTACVRRSLLKGPVPPGFPLAPDLDKAQPAPLEAQLVDLCDKVAYLCHDLDDGLRAAAFPVEDAARLDLWRRAAAAAESSRVHRIISEMVAVLIHDVLESTAPTLDGDAPRIRHGDAVLVMMEELQRFLRDRFYRADFVLEKMTAGRTRIRQVFGELRGAPERLPDWVRMRIDADGVARVVCDYVAGMTDRFLIKFGAAPAGP